MLRPVHLAHPILTQRLRLEPVTPSLALAAREGPVAFAHEIGADAPADWCAGSLALVARSAGTAWGSADSTRVVAIHRRDGVVIGDVRFEPPEHRFRHLGDIEIGYSVAPSRRREGYAVEAARGVIEWLSNAAGIETILAGCDKDNRASIRTLMRLGFHLDSTPGRVFWWVLPVASATRA